jgi:uncharacterized protein YabE (DUF348 family)
VHIWLNGREKTFLSPERIPANLLMQAGVGLFPGDSLYWNGQPVAPDVILPGMAAYSLQYLPSIEVTLVEDGKETHFFSSRPNLGQALADQGILVTAGDSLSQPLDSPLDGALTVVLKRGRTITITVGEKSVKSRSAAATVGQALAQAGVSLQGLDFSIPDADQPLPADGKVRVVRVAEELIQEQKVVHFKTEYVTDAALGAGEQKVLQEGKDGLQVSRVRVRSEDGKEVLRTDEGTLNTVEPVSRKLAVGSKINPGTIPLDGTNLDYWRAVTVYATSYSPCRSGGTRCYPYTASGAKAEKGIIAVTSAWYKQLAGLRVYIPGYGTAVIGDIGGGIPGKNWIDLAYSDNDYVGWSQNVTMYFLNPPPAVIPSIP